MINHPLSDLISRMNNTSNGTIVVNHTKDNFTILNILLKEGYIKELTNKEGVLSFNINYLNKIKVMSTPGRRKYIGWREIRTTQRGLGLSVIRTSQGILSDKIARELKLGGELLFVIF